MKPAHLAIAAIALTTGIAGCSSAPAKSLPVIVGLEWETEGGITGRGDGTLGIRGSQTVATDATGRICSGAMTGKDAEELTRLVGAVDQEIWGSKLLAPGADFFTYTLRIETEDGVRDLVWNDGAALPREVNELRRFLLQLKQRSLTPCL